MGVKAVENKNDAGFTLIEILVVIVILALLAGVIIPKMTDAPGRARQSKARVQIKQIEGSLNMFKIDNGFFPSTDQGLESLVVITDVGEIPKKFKEGGYIKKIPKDPWDIEYLYLSPGEHGEFDLFSLGRDGEEDGDGENADVNNWDIE